MRTSARKANINSLDIAYLASVSQPTVSRALRGSPLVNAKTRERILKLARENNCKVDISARNLRAKHSKTIAILVHEESRASIAGNRRWGVDYAALDRTLAGCAGLDRGTVETLRFSR